MTNQEQLAQILKKKGIGPESSKSLKTEDIEIAKTLFMAENVSLTTKATLLTALLTLEATDIEQVFIDELLRCPTDYLPRELVDFTKPNAPLFQGVINRLISHRHLSFDEAYMAVSHLFDHTPDFQKGAFLEAERLKRETFEENSAFFSYLKNQVKPQSAAINQLIDIGDSYDGCTRTPSLNLFLATILGAAGFPTLVHGVDEVAPKEGVSHHQILQAAGKNPLKSPLEATKDLESTEIAWTYIDQSVYHPELYALKQVRKEMVKRPFLATFEKMLQPIVASNNYLVSQYTHKHYKLEVARLIQAFCDFELALHVKGIEGTCMMNPKIPTECIELTKDNYQEISIYGEDVGVKESLGRYENITPKLCLSIGLDILSDKDIPEKAFIVFQGATLIHRFFKTSYLDAEKLLKSTISSGKAQKHWGNAK